MEPCRRYFSKNVSTVFSVRSRPTLCRLAVLIDLVNKRPKLLLSSHVNLVDTEGDNPAQVPTGSVS
jgi:hypothetical protein